MVWEKVWEKSQLESDFFAAFWSKNGKHQFPPRPWLDLLLEISIDGSFQNQHKWDVIYPLFPGKLQMPLRRLAQPHLQLHCKVYCQRALQYLSLQTGNPQIQIFTGSHHHRQGWHFPAMLRATVRTGLGSKACDPSSHPPRTNSACSSDKKYRVCSKKICRSTGPPPIRWRRSRPSEGCLSFTAKAPRTQLRKQLIDVWRCVRQADRFPHLVGRGVDFRCWNLWNLISTP